MSRIFKFWGILAGMIAFIAMFMFLIRIEGTREKLWQLVKPDLIEDNANLKNENDRLKLKIASLTKQNLSLKKYLKEYLDGVPAVYDYWVR